MRGVSRRLGGTGVAVALAAIVLAGAALRIGEAAAGAGDEPPDSIAYARIAANLHEEGSFSAAPPGGREPQPASTYSPGLPLLVAGLYGVSGGVHLTFARVALALLGALAIPLAYLLGRRLAGAGAGLVAAAVTAFFPALPEYQGFVMTEPLAATLLAAALVLFFAAAEGERWGLWIGAGAALGALALVRPEYLPIALALPLLALLRRGRPGRSRVLRSVAMLAAALVVVAPWTIRNAIVLDRFVPISTGAGKTLYIGTSLAADGDAVKLREILLARYPHLRDRLARGGPLDDPHRYVLERLLAHLAHQRYPSERVDLALGRLGRAQLWRAASEHPLDLAGLSATKAFHTWTDAATETAGDPPWRAVQWALLVAALAGLALLAADRRFEALVLGLLVAYVTVLGAVLIATPRRELVAFPVLAALAATAVARAWRRVRSSSGAPPARAQPAPGGP